MREGIRGISEFVWRRVRGDPAAVFPPSEPPRCTQYPFGECLRLGLLPCVPADPVLVPALGYGLPLLAAVLAACAACTRRKPPEGYAPLENRLPVSHVPSGNVPFRNIPLLFHRMVFRHSKEFHSNSVHPRVVSL